MRARKVIIACGATAVSLLIVIVCITALKNAAKNEAVLAEVVQDVKFGQEPSNDVIGASTASPWVTPIEFYGRVVDGDGEPIENALIDFQWTDRSSSGVSSNRTHSAHDGTFRIQGIRGKALLVSVSHQEFHRTRSARQTFFYAGLGPIHKSDYSNPVHFGMAKKDVADPLVVLFQPTLLRRYSLDWVGTPLEISLATGRVVRPGEGDLVVRRWVDYETFKTGENYDWRFEIAVRDGGIVDSSDEFEFQAPDQGYRNAVEYGFRADDLEWSDVLRSQAFIKLQDGNFGRLKFRLIPRAQSTAFLLNAFINTNGTQNLEFDESLDNQLILR